jgi:hypothetical protein
MASVNEDRTHVVSRQRHRVWCQSTEIPVSHPRSPDNPPAIRHRRFWTCTTRSPNELDLLDTLHRHSGQPKQHRRTVTQARGLSRLLP